jgi:hypothetical protein
MDFRIVKNYLAHATIDSSDAEEAYKNALRFHRKDKRSYKCAYATALNHKITISIFMNLPLRFYIYHAPSFFRTTLTVLNRITTSSHKFQFLTYHESRAIL